MSHTPVWQEVESKVAYPCPMLVFLFGIAFLSAGGFCLLRLFVTESTANLWISGLVGGLFFFLGCFSLAFAVRVFFFPIAIRHAGPDVLPNVPQEPVVVEGAIVFGRLTHELDENAQGWEFRPAEKVRRNNKQLLFVFGLFLLVFSGTVTWILHSQMNIESWFISSFCGIVVTAVSGGTVVLLIGLRMRTSLREHPRLTIPRNGNDLELDSGETPDFAHGDLTTWLQWAFIGETQRRRLAIPRELVAAVQLCPWKYTVMGNGEPAFFLASQGLLVLTSPETTDYQRLPLLLTSDFDGAAKLMQRLASVLQVPYLFHIDAAGWKAEAIRAKTRPPLQTGGEET